ncbi:4597_t:CDS:2, partial [Ambispora leptoticha]
MSGAKIESATQFEAELKKISEVLQEKETEHTWQLLEKELKRLAVLTREIGGTYENILISSSKSLRVPIVNSLATERTRLSGAACEFVEELGRCLGPKFETLVDFFFPALLKLCARTNKVFITRAQKSIMTIIRNCKIPALIPKFKEALKDQNKTLRTSAAEFILVSLEVNDVGALSKYIADLEWAIREGAIDSTPAVRSTSKKTFEIFKLKFDLRIQDFVDTLSSTAQKYLGLQDKQSNKSARPPIRRFNSAMIGKEIPKQPIEENDIVIFVKNPPTNNNKIENTTTEKNTATAATAFVITFDEPNSLVNPGFNSPLKTKPKLTSAERVNNGANNTQIFSASAQRVPIRPKKAQTVPVAAKGNGVLLSLAGGAQRVKIKESSA